MTIKDVDLYSETTRKGLPAIQPAPGPGSVVPITFDAVAGGGTLAVGTPIYKAGATGLGNKCVPTAASGESLEIYGFVYPTPIVLDDSGGDDLNTVGTVMQKGSITYEFLEALRNGTETGTSEIAGNAQELKDMLRKLAVKDRGIHIDGLTKIGANDGVV